MYSNIFFKTASIEKFGEENIKKFIKTHFGNWPILADSDWNENDFDPIKIQVISRSFSMGQIVNVLVSSNPKDPLRSNLRVYFEGIFKNNIFLCSHIYRFGNRAGFFLNHIILKRKLV